jgi:2-polyprenyl-6-methoxyphenol hydroxylase-like FAD-dependent oxidoreductase
LAGSAVILDRHQEIYGKANDGVRSNGHHRDLYRAREEACGQIIDQTSDVTLDVINTDAPIVRFKQEGKPLVIKCDFVAGCDGFHGVARNAIPKEIITYFERVYPFGWLGVARVRASWGLTGRTGT